MWALLQSNRAAPDLHCAAFGMEPDAVTIEALARLQLAAARPVASVLFLVAAPGCDRSFR